MVFTRNMLIFVAELVYEKIVTFLAASGCLIALWRWGTWLMFDVELPLDC